MRYIDARKGRWGVEPICRALQFDLSTYYAARSRPPCARDLSDETLKVEIKRVYDASFDGCYGVKKVWKQLNFEQARIANCTVAADEGRGALGGASRSPVQADD